ncbi:MAG: glycoside hydrolase family 15 [Bacteroidales bacterium]|nr:glycoside hydrolase family 15 [Bacteroidales bacterium]
MTTEKLYDLWAARNPQWEKRYEDSIIKNFCDYGRGATSLREDRGKIFGGGYEIYIVAFFIGLYFNQKRKLIADSQKKKTFGQPIQYWGNLDSVKGRKAYPKLREYIFTALIARTDIDFIALEKGEITSRKAVDMLIQTMEQYANWGFHFMEDKLTDDPNYFYKETAFLEVFLAFDAPSVNTSDDDEPDSLD